MESLFQFATLDTSILVFPHRVCQIGKRMTGQHCIERSCSPLFQKIWKAPLLVEPLRRRAAAQGVVIGKSVTARNQA